jgi:hypothetical protein
VLVRLNKKKSGQYSERPYWELLPRPTPASDAAKSRSGPEDGSGNDDAADSLSAPSGSRLRLVVPGR